MNAQGTSSLVTPVRVYVDTNHLINLTRIRCGKTRYIPSTRIAAYRRLNSWLVQGFVRLVYSRAIAIEWCEGVRSHPDGWSGLADIARLFEDSHRVCGVWEVDFDRATYAAEALFALGLGETLDLSPLIWRRGDGWSNAWKLRTYFDEWSGADCETPSPEQFPTFREELFALTQALERGEIDAQERIDGWREAHRQTRETARQFRTIDARFLHAFLEHQLSLSEAIQRIDPECDGRERIRAIQPAQCPILWTYLRAVWMYAKEKEATKVNDADDWGQAHAAVLADATLTERALASYLTAANPSIRERVIFDPELFVESLATRIGV